jgi:hypothetical protein
MLLLALLGLNRRQYEVQATQSEALLEQTRLAQAEQSDVDGVLMSCRSPKPLPRTPGTTA